jgi:hypothetical protein
MHVLHVGRVLSLHRMHLQWSPAFFVSTWLVWLRSDAFQEVCVSIQFVSAVSLCVDVVLGWVV